MFCLDLVLMAGCMTRRMVVWLGLVTPYLGFVGFPFLTSQIAGMCWNFYGILYGLPVRIMATTSIFFNLPHVFNVKLWQWSALIYFDKLLIHIGRIKSYFKYVIKFRFCMKC